MAEEKDVAANEPVDKPKAPRKKAAPAAKPTPKAASKASADPEQLAAEIERTREELAETLDAIADKVSPKRVAKRTTKKVATAVKDTAHDAAEAVKDTAASAKDKMTGHSAEPAVAAEPISLVSEAPRPAYESATEPYVVPDYPPAQPFIKKEYVVAGVAGGLIALWLLRRRGK
jgi:hypothetical protein